MSAFPETPVATAVSSVASRFYSPALLNHCIRSYLWAKNYAAAHDIEFDHELLYVATMLHDVALTETFDSHRVPFEEAGGELAWVFATAAGWPKQRAARAREIIHQHIQPDVAPTDDPESHLIQVATGWDVVGLRPEEFPEQTRTEILARYPRQGFSGEFLTCFQDQATRKPDSAGAVLLANIGAAFVGAHPLDG